AAVCDSPTPPPPSTPPPPPTHTHTHSMCTTHKSIHAQRIPYSFLSPSLNCILTTCDRVPCSQVSMCCDSQGCGVLALCRVCQEWDVLPRPLKACLLCAQ